MLSDFKRALRFLTILPVDIDETEEARPMGYASAYFTLIGVLFGGIGALVMSLQLFDARTRAFLVLLVWSVLSGGLHLDGFADSCDGLLATTTPERRLEIMKDPRTGTRAVVGLVLLLLGKWLLLIGLPPLWIVLPPVLGRLAMVWLAAQYLSARPEGLGAAFRTGLGRDQVLVATLIGALCLFAVMLSDWRVMVSALSLPIVVLAFGRFAASRLGGGLTGDTYGAGCELTEWLCLLLLNLL
ncbi:MAG: adenosylcobinamide-GDP ribazoletransferase [Candidatus Thermofonsia Clade 1 bacterium]|uniref:Adenosylcobinamide-GDP ribazoletransferase n=1 Tax=Candidatus Thermofonsia Clade 1 bacterium TaxID=2364210 RepID=A0A2M8NYJ3_9CHLR|nr:MAG: adenosylcobinamide-GDP ribazoletransferase [Candidatus Thermofonsia Clade 1 bacterium]